MNKPTEREFVTLRPKEIFGLETLGERLENLRPRVLKGSGGKPRLTSDVPEQSEANGFHSHTNGAQPGESNETLHKWQVEDHTPKSALPPYRFLRKWQVGHTSGALLESMKKGVFLRQLFCGVYINLLFLFKLFKLSKLFKLLNKLKFGLGGLGC